MNELSFINNRGYLFEFYPHHDGCSVRVKDPFGKDLGMTPYIYLNDLTDNEIKEVYASEKNERERVIIQLLYARFVKFRREIEIGGRKRIFSVQCHDYKGKPFVVFEKYGLQGGGKKKSLTFGVGVLEVASGIVILTGTATTLPLILASGLLAAGCGTMYRAVKTPEEKITAPDVALQTVVSFTGGAMGGAAGTAVSTLAAPGLNAMGTAMLAGVAINTTSTVTSTLTEATIQQDPKVLAFLTPKNLMVSAGAGMLTGGLSRATQGAMNCIDQSFFDPFSAEAQIVFDGLAGATSNTGVKITDNWFKQRHFLKVTYETIPAEDQIEPGKLYLFLQNEEICFLSVNRKSQTTTTRIKEESQFLIASQDPETQFDTLKIVLESKGTQKFNKKQKQFILDNAYKYQHIPVNLTSELTEAALVGASIGAITVLTTSNARHKSSSLAAKNITYRKLSPSSQPKEALESPPLARAEQEMNQANQTDENLQSSKETKYETHEDIEISETQPLISRQNSSSMNILEEESDSSEDSELLKEIADFELI